MTGFYSLLMFTWICKDRLAVFNLCGFQLQVHLYCLETLPCCRQTWDKRHSAGHATSLVSMALCFLADLASHNPSDLLFTSPCTYILPNMRLMGTRHGYTNLSHLFCGTDGPIFVTEQFVQVFQLKYLSRRSLLFHRIEIQVSALKKYSQGSLFVLLFLQCFCGRDDGIL